MKYGIVLFILSIVFSVILLNPSVKKKTMELLLQKDKKVLSQLEVEHEGTRYKIVKVQTVEGLGVEFFKIVDNEVMFLDSHQLTDKKDASYKFGEEKHNLFLKDVSDPQDGTPEVILPSIDKNMRARLNIFHINYIDEKLEKISSH